MFKTITDINTFCNINAKLLAEEFAYFFTHFLDYMSRLITHSSNTIKQDMALVAVMTAELVLGKFSRGE